MRLRPIVGHVLADPAAPAGLAYQPDFLSPDEERLLLDRVAALPFGAVVMHGVAARRTVVHYGWDYAYDAPTIVPADPLPQFLHELRRRAAELAGLDPDAFGQALVARYPPGATIGWHRDAPMFGPVVLGVSLASACIMRFRRARRGAYDRYKLTLQPRSVYVLSGAARASWQHSIPAVDALRYSITFRTVRSRYLAAAHDSHDSPA